MDIISRPLQFRPGLGTIPGEDVIIMPLFGFAERYAMFDVTPVENLFIQEYMLRADGDFVKVYLYGLMQCYHPVESASMHTVARDLGMEEKRVENAFAYWERVGLVRRVADNPPAYAFQNLKQIELMRAQDDDGLYKYADFNNSLQAQFGADRLLHPQDFERVYDWIEGLGLPEEVVLMLVSGQIKARNSKKFPFKSLDHIARQWSEAGVRTIADAEAMSRTYTEQYAAVKRLYQKLGKRHGVSEPDEALYSKWTQEWGFSHQTILDAANETSKGVPTFGYLDSILARMHREGMRSIEDLAQDKARDADVKTLLSELGMRGTSPTDDSRSLLEGFLAEGFDRETIAVAAKRVARKGGKLDALQKTLDIWKQEGVRTLADTNAYLAKIDSEREQKSNRQQGKTVRAQQYTQRHYTKEELAELVEVL